MPAVNSFKDHNGKKGKIGSKVYHWHYDIGNDTSIEEKSNKAKTVIEIYTQGAGGTKIKLEGDRVGSVAKDYVIIEE